jgi:6-phosphogluconolactonase
LSVVRAPLGRILVGTYTADMGGESAGILELTGGRVETLVDTKSPSFLLVNGDVVYAVNEGTASMSEYRRTASEHTGTADGAGFALVATRSTPGDYPCHIALVPGLLIVSCYANGAIGAYSLGEHGELGELTQSFHHDGSGPRRQQLTAHAHCALMVDDTTVLTADLGTDTVHIFDLNDGVLSRSGAVHLPAGAGPRDLVRHRSGRVLVLAELSCELFVIERNGDDWMVVGQTPLPGAEPDDQAAAVAMTLDGRRLFSGLRGSNRISTLHIDDKAVATAIGWVDCGGETPRHMIVVDSQLIVANQQSSRVSVFDVAAGGLPEVVESFAVPTPTYLVSV